MKLPFKPNTFDFVFSNGVIHHIASPHAAFKNLSELVKNKGHFYIGVYGRGLNQGLLDKLLRYIFSGINIKWAIRWVSMFDKPKTMLWSEKINMLTVPSIQYRFYLNEIMELYNKCNFINVTKNNTEKTKNQEKIERFLSATGYKILKIIYGTFKGGRDSVWHEIIGEKKS